MIREIRLRQIKLNGQSVSKQVLFGVHNQNTQVQPDDVGLFLLELKLESREKGGTLLELMPGLESC